MTNRCRRRGARFLFAPGLYDESMATFSCPCLSNATKRKFPGHRSFDYETLSSISISLIAFIITTSRHVLIRRERNMAPLTAPARIGKFCVRPSLYHTWRSQDIDQPVEESSGMVSIGLDHTSYVPCQCLFITSLVRRDQFVIVGLKEPQVRFICAWDCVLATTTMAIVGAPARH